ncbi:dynamin family protein [Kyrpidia spormannii]|uniref:Dynamin N-terminal domain-containing protein n=1 Tax=Kyrpidia spormannii TaxID=2055160 RepID=A0A6F9EF46_9BACL|nr:dynamin family protein [Kyrpidia spormannii]CAB3394951.1 conserved protein of unknown function [Kyrpidia spormannii]
MAQVVTSFERDLALVESLARLMEEWGDGVRAARVREVAEKYARREVIVAFCGHFSAGKSTLINKWLGEDVLPSGPVPTTAAGVLIRRGAPGLRICDRHRVVRQLEAKNASEELSRWCTSEEDVRLVEVGNPSIPLPEGAAFLDTPGVDSTDPAHREMTEAVLHLADAVVYTMDYNHVQAEANLTFLRRLTDGGVPVFLVINQIDKHAEDELPFLQFQYETAQIFKAFGIPDKRIYYVSLRDPQHPYHQFQELREDVSEFMAEAPRWYRGSVGRALRGIVEDHLKAWRAGHREEIEAARALLGEEHARGRVERFDQLSEEERRWQDPEGHLEAVHWPELVRMVENAPITPYEIGEMARAYLDSLRPGFRPGGWFGGRGRTEKEREARAAALSEAFGRRLETELDRHVRSWARDLAAAWGVANGDLLDRIDGAPIFLSTSEVAALVKPGAVVEAGYVQTYLRDLETAGKERYRKLGRRLLEMIEQAIRERREAALAAISEERGRLAPYSNARDQLEILRGEEERRRTALWERIPFLEGDGESPSSAEEAATALDVGKEMPRTSAGHAGDVPPAEEVEDVAEIASEKVATDDANVAGVSGSVDVPSGWLADAEVEVEVAVEGENGVPSVGPGPRRTGDPRLLAAAEQLRQAAEILAILPGTAKMTSALLERAARLEEREFTVALFGAFSAGKSSLANALLGSAVLPSSPNPTTAAVQRVRAPEGGHPHGTAVLHIRARSEMEKVLEELESRGEEEACTAIRQHWKEIEPYFGQALRAHWSRVRQVTAEERWAAYFSHLDIFWDCPFTAGGWVLVDTPGVDSVHGRHTDTAFESIRHSDAVVFVTYYNHAFSRADEAFLTQLGKMQETFDFEKVFFVVNAGDLAANEQELQGVVQHVRRNLTNLGIVRPRIYPLSSRGALLARKAQTSSLSPGEEAWLRTCLKVSAGPLPSLSEALEVTGFAGFYRDFSSLLRRDWAEMALGRAWGDLRRAEERLRRWVMEARAEGVKREERRQAWSAGAERVEASLSQVEDEPLLRGLEGEIAELCDHIERRLWIRYQDRFRESFSVAALEDGRREAVAACAADLAEWLEDELSQEWKAAALRAERWFRDRRTEIWAERVSAASGDLAGWSWEPEAVEPWEIPAQLIGNGVGETIRNLGPKLFPGMKRWLGPGMDEMREALWEAVLPQVRGFVDGLRKTMGDWARQCGRPVLESDRRAAKESAREYAAGMMAALDHTLPPERLEEALRRLPRPWSTV